MPIVLGPRRSRGISIDKAECCPPIVRPLIQPLVCTVPGLPTSARLCDGFTTFPGPPNWTPFTFGVGSAVLQPSPGLVQFFVPPPENDGRIAQIVGSLAPNPTTDFFCFCGTIDTEFTGPDPGVGGIALSATGLGNLLTDPDIFTVTGGALPGLGPVQAYRLVIGSGVATTVVDTGILTDTGPHTFKVCNLPGGLVTFTFDGVPIPVVVVPGSIPNVALPASIGVTADGNNFPGVTHTVNDYCLEVA